MTLSQRIAAAARFVVLGPQARYEGARRSPMRSNIPAAVQSAKWDITPPDRHELLRKSRYFEKNNGLCNRLADIYEQYTVGQGLRMLPDSSDVAWNTTGAMPWWEDWQRFADIASRSSWGTLQGVIARTLMVDGEIFVLLTIGSEGFPRVQLIEGHRVRTPPNRKEGDGIVDGIEIDGNGRPVAYWIAKDNVARSTEFVRQDAAFVVHVFEPSRAGQYRGLPMLYPVLNDLNDLDDLQVLEMQAAKDQAKTTKIVKTKEGEISDEDLLRGTTTGTDGVQRTEYYQDVFSGAAAVLRPGDDFQQFPGERPSNATSGYWDRLERNICAGVGIPREIVIPQSMQGTSMRSVLDIANAFFRSRSAVMADHFARVYEYVMRVGMTSGRVPEGPSDWWRCTYRSPRSINVDVGRNSAAAIAEWKAGMRTMRDTYAETGDDWEQQLEQRAREAKRKNELAAKYGVTPAEIVMLDPNEISSANAAANA